MASTVAPPTTLQTTPSTSLSSPGLSPTSSNQLSPDDVELLAKLEEQNSGGVDPTGKLRRDHGGWIQTNKARGSVSV
ncbi:unnamed protein product [Boreogadus saida]